MNDLLFKFYTTGVAPADGRLIVRIPKDIKDKSSLLRLIAELLLFPSYFGQNWDALDECLGDLSWIMQSAICLWHDDIPLANDPNGAQRYLQVLDGVLREPGNVRLEVYFPEKTRKEVEAFFAA
jgi:RNAse (barnase) inhibitor barstar